MRMTSTNQSFSRRLRFVAILASLGVATGVSAQTNLLANPRFDADLGGWEMAFGRPSQWDAEDVFGDPLSGSALLSHEEAVAGGFLTILRQCVPIPGPGNFRIGGWIKNLPDQPVAGSAAITVAAARFADCTGGFGNATGPAAASSPNWQYREWDFGVSHATIPYAAIMVNLAILKAQATTEPRRALFDDLELISLESPDPIYADGFDGSP